MTNFAMWSSLKVDLPPTVRAYYDQLFKIADTDNDGFIGVNDSAFFRKSNLPNQVLGEIWQLSDARQEGRLDKEGFIAAMCLISLAQQGKPLALQTLSSYVPPPPKLADVPSMKPPDTPQVGAGGSVGVGAQQPGDWVVSPQERKQFLDLFRAHDDDGDGFITGQQARTLFSASQLPLQQLGVIWGMADMNKDQKLDAHEFIIAMYLITAKKRGLELPAVVPDTLIQSAWPDPSSPTQTSLPPGQLPTINTPTLLNPPKVNEWVIPPAEKIKYDDLFKKTDTDTDGYITGEQARQLFSRSGVPLQELGRIWLLSDLNQDQRLDKQEFAIAMFLIHCRLKGREFPTPLPDALIASARDDYAPPSQTPSSVIKSDKSRYEINLDEISTPTGVGANAAAGNSGTVGFPPHAASVPAPAPTPDGPVPVGAPHLERRFNSTTNLMAHSQTPTPATAVTSPVPGSSASASAQYLSPAIGMSPAVSSAPAVMSGSFSSPLQALSPQFGSVQLVPSSALELERTRQSVQHHERTKAELSQQLNEVTTTGNETARLLEEERARHEALIAEIKDLESQIGAQRARGASFKDNITAIRLEVKNMTTQKEQLEQLLKEKREQCDDQEQILGELRIELGEKTGEVERLQREVEQQKVRLEALRSSTAEVKSQLASVKKQITENKSEINRLSEETKNLKISSVSSSSPPLNARTGSPMVFPSNTPPLSSSQPHHPPIQRTSSSLSNSAFPAHPESTSATSSPALSHHTATSSPSPTSFNFNNDHFFDNGQDDPFAFNSKDGFGLAGVTKDSFGGPAHSPSSSSLSISNVPPTPAPSVENTAFGADSGNFFATTDAFGGVEHTTKDPFTSSNGSNPDPFASSFAFGGSVGADAFEFGTVEDFGGGSPASVSKLPPATPANSVIQGSVVVPPTPHNTVIGEKKGGLSSKDIASAFSTAAFGGSTGAETTNSFFGSTEDSFAASAFADAFGKKDSFGSNDSFGTTNDAFGNHDAFGAHDAFGSHDAFGGAAPTGDGGLKQSGGFAREASFRRDSGGGSGSRGSPAFPVEHDAFGTTKRDSGSHKLESAADPFHKSQDAFRKSQDDFGKKDSGGTGVPPPAAHPFGNDAFGSADAFGPSDAFGANDAFGNAHDAFGTGSHDAFGGNAHDAFGTGTNDAFGSGGDAFGTGHDAFATGHDAFGSANGAFGVAGDAFGTANDAFGKGDAFGKDVFAGHHAADAGSHSRTNSTDSNFAGNDVFGKNDTFGTFNFGSDGNKF